MSVATIETGRGGSWSSLSVLLTGCFLTILDLFIVNVALPDIQRELHASNAELQLIMVAYDVPFGAMLLNGARLGDLFGRRRLFLIGMATFALASLLCALAPSPSLLIGSRAIQGVGAALMMPQIYASVRLLFDGDARRRAFAIMGAVQGVAGAASQVIGGYLIAINVGDLGWRLVFLVNLPVALYALVAGRWMIVETKEALPTKLDIRGAVLGASALTLVLFPLMVGREHHWPWWAIVGPLASLPLFAYFAWYEIRLARRGGVPVIDISLFKRNGFTLGIITAFLFFSTISSFSLSLTVFLQVGLGRTALEAGTIFVPSTVAFFVGSLLSEAVAKKTGHWAVFLGMLIYAIGLIVSVAVGFDTGSDNFMLSLSLILNGLGQGIVIPLFLNLILSTVSNSEAGMASGACSTMQTAGAAFGITIVGIILFSVLDSVGLQPGSPLTSAEHYGYAFAVATIYNLVAVILSLVLFVRLQNTLSRQ
ncbi:MFS transporter [Rhizobium rhizogenes]|uniref:MFS transporter n=1 Tax=Rhizobium rhizogenes TaxID=359 RepID=UPI00157493A8|nr:MFS transporter [Rhizobium rhizogenes]NTF66246.1 MFS transporter [Rhizobium rhizogenes]NTG97299.1 MFS transporter [Rhizobium rhizogenes]